MIKHTPGDWHVGGQQKCTIYDKFGQRIANSFEGVMAMHRTDIECAANARLIAAAPELLEALNKLFGADMAYCMEMDGKQDQLDAIEFARSAIAKAVGE